jgi:hypothetical protein
VDQLDVIARVEPFMVRHHHRDHAILNEYVPVAAGLCVDVLDAQQLGRPCWLPARDMDGHHQLLLKAGHAG